MRVPRSSLVLFAVALAVPLPALSQICRGTVPLAGSIGNVNAAVALFDDGRTYGGAVTVGSTIFGSASYGYTEYDVGTGIHLNSLGGSIGYEMTQGESGLSVCPIVGVGYGWGFEIVGVDFTTMALTGGAGLGYRIEIEPGVFVIPSSEVVVARDRIRTDAGASGTADTYDTYGLVTLSMGFLMRRQRAALAPSVQIPVASDGGSAVFGIGVTLAFGR
ncbi:MAG: hypothetical protein ABL963_11235 [Longimicrobiales bacterium]